MTIDEAIKVLERKRETEPGGSLGEEWDALNMGIEALGRCKAYKDAHVAFHYEPMPGETA